MVIAGAGGFAKELYSEWIRNHINKKAFFFDDINEYEDYSLLDTLIFSSVSQVIENGETEFIIGVGGYKNREILFNKLSPHLLPKSFVSQHAIIGEYGVNIEKGATIMAGAILTVDIMIGKGTLINIGATIGHDSVIGDFCDICPGVHISGNCRIGNNVFIGTGSVILPGVTVGDNVIIGAGSVVIKDIASNCKVVGVPAKEK